MARHLWISRHGNRQDFVDPNWHQTADRPHDPGLAPDGVDQAHQLGDRVQTLGVDRVLASPFLRTVHTAHVAAEKMEAPVFLEPSLGEWMNPDWFDDVPDLLPLDRLQSRFARVRTASEPCGRPAFPETKQEAFDRIGRAARCLVQRYENETLWLVGHGITMQGVLLGLVGDIPDTGVPLASLTHLVRDNGTWTIRVRNDVSHLYEGAKGEDRLT